VLLASTHSSARARLCSEEAAPSYAPTRAHFVLVGGLLDRVRSHCRFAQPSIHLISDLRRRSVPIFLKRQCDRTLPSRVLAPNIHRHACAGGFRNLSSPSTGPRCIERTKRIESSRNLSSRRHWTIAKRYCTTRKCKRPRGPGGRLAGRFFFFF
jgi:hypothetical protein